MEKKETTTNIIKDGKKGGKEDKYREKVSERGKGQKGKREGKRDKEREEEKEVKEESRKGRNGKLFLIRGILKNNLNERKTIIMREVRMVNI